MEKNALLSVIFVIMTFFQSVFSMVETIVIIGFIYHLDGSTKQHNFGCFSCNETGVSDKTMGLRENELIGTSGKSIGQKQDPLKKKRQEEVAGKDEATMHTWAGKTNEEMKMLVRNVDMIFFLLNLIMSISMFVWLLNEWFENKAV